MTNPHDAPSPHSKKWDVDEKRYEEGQQGYGSGGRSSSYGSGGYNPDRPGVDWTGGTGRSPYEKRGRGKKAAVVIISILSLVLIAIVFGNGINLPDVEIPDLKQLVGGCDEYDRVSVNTQTTKGTVSLLLCDGKDLTVSTKLSESSQIQIILYDPNSRKISQKAFVDKEFDYVISPKFYNDFGEYKIKVKINGNFVNKDLVFKVQ